MTKIVAKITPKKKGNWWLVDTGRYLPKRRRRRFATKALADDYIAALFDPTKKKSTQSLADIINRYHTWSETIKQKAPNSIRSERTCLKIFRQWTETKNIISISDITIDQIRAFQEYYFENGPFPAKPFYRRPQRKATAAAWEKYRQVLSAFFNWCISRNLVDSNPVKFREFKIKVQQKIPRIFTIDEMKKLFDYFDRQDDGKIMPQGILFRLLAYTGMRISEAMNLTWPDVDLEAGVIKITKSKSKKIRSIPIHADLSRRLKSLPTRDNKYVLDNGCNEWLYSTTWYRAIHRKALNACAIEHRPIHSFRHSFAAHLVMKGVDIFTVKELLGHSDIKMTTIYLHFSADHAKDAIKKLPY